MLMLFTSCSRRGLCGFPKPELCTMSSRTQAYCTNYCTNAVDTPRYLATFSDTTIKKDPRFLGSSWLVNDGCWWRWGGVELPIQLM